MASVIDDLVARLVALGHDSAVEAEQFAIRQARKDTILEFKKLTPCADCKHNFAHYQKNFDHVDRATKIKNVSFFINNLYNLVTELQKCELVCMNCHAAREWKRDQALKIDKLKTIKQL